MSYEPSIWRTGDTVTAEKLNKIEQAIVADNTAIEGKVGRDEFDTEIATLESKVGSPLIASTVSEMTETDRVYVYTGSETGYTSGNWYYYDGTAWTSGGVYNAVAIETDTTLSVSGKAADAKKAGDEINSLKEELNAIQTATSDDVGKALKAKTVTNGKVTEWEFGDTGSGDAEYLEEQIETFVYDPFYESETIIAPATVKQIRATKIFFDADTILLSYTPEFVFENEATTGQFRWDVVYDYGGDSGYVSLSDTLKNIADCGDTIDLSDYHFLNNHYALLVCPCSVDVYLQDSATNVQNGNYSTYGFNYGLNRINLSASATLSHVVPAGTYVVRNSTLTNDVTKLQSDLDDTKKLVLSAPVASTLLKVLSKVAWVGENGGDLINELQDVLFARQADHYTFYDYIQQTSGHPRTISAIVASMEFDTTCSIETTIYYTKTNVSNAVNVLGAKTANAGKAIGVFATSSTGKLGYWYGNKDTLNTITPLTVNHKNHIVMKPVGTSETYPDNVVIDVNDTEYNSGVAVTSYDYPTWLGFFNYAVGEGEYNTEGITYDMGLQIGKTIIRGANGAMRNCFVPAYDGVHYGMYDTMNNRFFYDTTYPDYYACGYWD